MDPSILKTECGEAFTRQRASRPGCNQRNFSKRDTVHVGSLEGHLQRKGVLAIVKCAGLGIARHLCVHD